jgi:formylglycine-generating enzyme required for sulfatase activity
MAGEFRRVTDNTDVFLSYSHNDLDAAALLHTQLESAGLSVFRDEKGIRWSDQWLDRLQEAVSTCKSFVVLVGRDGVRRWIGAETQVALKRYFGPHDDSERLPIYPILLGETKTDALPVFLQLFQATPWNGDQSLPDGLIEQIRSKVIVTNDSIRVDRRPFLGLRSFGPEDTQMFFGRQEETLDALSCFNTRKEPVVRWLEINGNSGCGKSSLMNAGLLPLVEKGWLWRRTGYEHWTCIGPMMPGIAPVEMLAECLAKAFDGKMGELVAEFKGSDDALRYWLRERKAADTAFLLAVDQFEELFNFADRDERGRFDRLLAAALEDADCPLFVISTVRADFLDRFDDLPRLVSARNRIGKPWTLAPIGPDGLREVIEGPARLSGLDVGEVKGLILDQAKNEPGALPLVEHALEWLWNNQSANRLSERRFHEAGGLAGILSHAADELLATLDAEGRTRALELLFRLVKVDPEGIRHARQPLSMADAEKVAGAGEPDRDMIDRLAGQQTKGLTSGPVRLITITEEGRWVNLIHETLIRSKGLDAEGKPQPYWPTLWGYIDQHKERAAWRERLQGDLRTWLEKEKAPGFQWSHERVRELHTIMQRPGPRFELNPIEREFVGPIDPNAMRAELEKSETTHRRRALIGERLDVLGDPRPGVRVDANGTPEINWRPVEGGEVAIAILSDPDDLYAREVDAPTHTVRAFDIGRYPVTVAQYQAFLEAEDGWRNKEWWAGDLYRDPEGDTYQVGRFADHPAVYVSWFDAMAFCRWLGRRLDRTVCLPDEWQWQRAALGDTDGSAFPWGAPDWDAKGEPHRANTFESRLGQVTAVGMYPAGASPCGALDMAGTVWEWCLNKFDTPEDTDSRADDFDPRVLRGGSWDDYQDFARSANRFRDVPVSRSDLIGFRVVCSAPSLDTDS